MTVEFVQGDLFEHPNLDAIVIPVNCVGVPGKGLALEARRRRPDWLSGYFHAFREGLLKPGHVIWHSAAVGPVAVSFCTKDHWKAPSELLWVEAGLTRLVALSNEQCVQQDRVLRVGVPALGCGLGGLAWPAVKARMEEHFDCTTAEFVVFDRLKE